MPKRKPALFMAPAANNEGGRGRPAATTTERPLDPDPTEDQPMAQGDERNDDGSDEGGREEVATQLRHYQPKAPPRSPAPAIFRAWRQDEYGALMMQAVVQDDAEALVWMLEHNLVELAATDDLGNTAAHLAVFHDSPRVLRLLHQLGLDLSATCDANGFGSAIFYSVYLGRVECLEELIALGYDVSLPCDGFGRPPEIVAKRHDQGAALDLVRRSLACLKLQRLTRGFLGRQKAKHIKAAWGRAAKKEVDAVESTLSGGDAIAAAIADGSGIIVENGGSDGGGGGDGGVEGQAEAVGNSVD